jgi:hypothetical protein
MRMMPRTSIVMMLTVCFTGLILARGGANPGNKPNREISALGSALKLINVAPMWN